MGDKSGALFNMIIVVFIASILIAIFAVMFPDLANQIKDGAKNMITKGFAKSGLDFISFLVR